MEAVMSELAYLPLVEVAQRYRDKSLSPVEYVEALNARIDAHDNVLNAFLFRRPEESVEQARAAEARFSAGKPSGPMDGIPFGLKDIIDAEGWPTTCHSAILADNVATADAPVSANLKGAGGILLGKLATHEFAFGGPSFDLPYPPARNPWNPKIWPGGSSSGSGAAVAAGFLPGALGTDTGGSVRNPSSVCGIVGMKATYGRVSRRGVFPLSYSLDYVGPMTRTVADNAYMLNVLSGFDAVDPGSADQPVPDFSAGLDKGVAGMKIGFVRHFHERDLIADEEMVAGIDSALEVLRSLGAEIVEIETHPLGAFSDCNRVILTSEAFSIHETWLKAHPEKYSALCRERLMPGAFMSAADYVQATRLRTKLTRDFNASIHGLDAIITASSMEQPFPIDDVELMTYRYPRHARTVFNLTGHPALAVPTGMSRDGLPLAMQIVGHPFDEATVYRVARAYERETGITDNNPDPALWVSPS
jgi:aspartyl-tRNA(Asn)/glutamyl-tRNA(Gln) amidotransferase subunit A